MDILAFAPVRVLGAISRAQLTLRLAVGATVQLWERPASLAVETDELSAADKTFVLEGERNEANDSIVLRGGLEAWRAMLGGAYCTIAANSVQPCALASWSQAAIELVRDGRTDWISAPRT